MFRTPHGARTLSPSGLLQGLGRRLSNFLRRAGLEQTSASTNASQAHGMSSPTHRRRIFPSLPRDYIHRRRLRRRISNAIVVPLLSLVAAYFIARPSGGSGFSRPKSLKQSSLDAAIASESSVPAGVLTPSESASAALATTSAANPAPGPIIAGAYRLADGPHGVSEVSDLVLHDAKRSKD